MAVGVLPYRYGLKTYVKLFIWVLFFGILAILSMSPNNIQPMEQVPGAILGTIFVVILVKILGNMELQPPNGSADK